MTLPGNQGSRAPDADYLQKLFRRHVQGAFVRSWASLVMWVFALGSFLSGLINKDQFAGISASVAFLVLMNLPTLLILKHITQMRLYRFFSLAIHVLEIIGYTSIIYFVGGIEATYLILIYALLITYVGVVAPRKMPYIIASICSMAFALMVVLQYLGFLPNQYHILGLYFPWKYQLAYLFVIIALLFVEAFIASYTASLLKKNREKLQQQNAELAQAKEAAEAASRDLQLALEELERAYKELKTSRVEIIQQEKMASIGQLAAGVAHEINNPTGFVSSNLRTLGEYLTDLISLIRQYRELLSVMQNEGRDGDLSAKMEQILTLEKEIDIDYVLDDVSSLVKESHEGMERINKIVMDLKDFAHPGDDQLRPADINKNLDSTLNVVWNELKYKATVRREYGQIPLIPCIAQQLNQVFLNLLVNAAQAIKEKGEICIRTQSDNGYVEIQISDTGEGIPPENLPRIFDPFFTTKEVGKGTGLGLHMVHSIVKRHNGTIDVKSEVGKGTTFTVRIPLGS
jgi:signal transduction histidine kinase